MVRHGRFESAESLDAESCATRACTGGFGGFCGGGDGRDDVDGIDQTTNKRNGLEWDDEGLSSSAIVTAIVKSKA